MTKQDLQKELKEKVREGVKPSDLRKLKKSKSESDIPSPTPNTPLKKSQSQVEIPLTQTKEQQITQLQEQVKFHAETASNYLKSLQTSQAKVNELEEKLKSSPTNLEELDNSLLVRHKSLKDWFSQYQKNKKLDQELASNIDEVSEELVEQDKMISNLQGQVVKLKKDKESLQKDLELVGRLAESRKVPYPEDNWTYLKYALYSLVAVLFTLWLTNNLKKEKQQ